MKAFEIFRTGKHTSDKGITNEYTNEDLDKIVNNYNPQEHEAPIVIGHPKTNAPAYGWIEKLQRIGDKLFAFPKQLNKEFEELVKSGAFKKRSISITPDFKLNHVGFLGAAAPAVKGLKDVEFSEEQEFSNFEFDDIALVQDDDLVPHHLNSAPQHDTDDKNNSQDETGISHNAPDPTPGSKPDAANDLSAQFNSLNAKVEELSDLVHNFSENNLSKEELDKVYNRINELRFSIQTNEFELMLNEKLAYGSVTPAMKTKVIKLLDFLQSQNFSSSEFSQNEFNESVKEMLTEFINSIPKIIYYEDFAEKEISEEVVEDEFEGAEVDRDSLSIHKKALALAKSEKISYVNAVKKLSTKV
jgi:hypothetical protein